MFQRSKEAGTHYIRGLPGEIEEDPATRSLRLVVENTTSGKLETHELDMVVLSVGVQPPKDLAKISSLLTLSKTSDGFFMESHPKLKPVDAPTRGVYFAGFCESPKDIKTRSARPGRRVARRRAASRADQNRGDHQPHRRGRLHQVRRVRARLSLRRDRLEEGPAGGGGGGGLRRLRDLRGRLQVQRDHNAALHRSADPGPDPRRSG
jgi:hypothetical protein